MRKDNAFRLQKLGIVIASVGVTILFAGFLSVGAVFTGLNGFDEPLGVLGALILLVGLAVVYVGGIAGGDLLR